MEFTHNELVDFLLEAKRHTYAGQDDEASTMALLPGSRQLEYREDPLFYRDIYFGSDYFVGQETVQKNDLPIWAMCYAGGVNQSVDASEVYKFLRSALLAVPPENPYRGPETFVREPCCYMNKSHGDVERFWGVETISRGNERLYELRYAGGSLH